ncbi:signal peptidase I family protein [Lentinula edodes]|uniref:Signal peptidase I family protein n=1 Tax=Lentinula edodes TaxID=5353 RepID=A0A1Q3EQ85_LENED|nr:signal peptidase I family protein [Lentinula edodes]
MYNIDIKQIVNLACATHLFLEYVGTVSLRRPYCCDVVCVDPTGLKAPSTEHVLVPKGHIWICGDNMTHSRDSRDYGPVPIALIRSKLFARVLPLKDRIIFRNPMRVLD